MEILSSFYSQWRHQLLRNGKVIGVICKPCLFYVIVLLSVFQALLTSTKHVFFSNFERNCLKHVVEKFLGLITTIYIDAAYCTLL